MNTNQVVEIKARILAFLVVLFIVWLIAAVVQQFRLIDQEMARREVNHNVSRD